MDIKKYLDIKSDNSLESYYNAHHHFKYEIEVCIGISREVIKHPPIYLSFYED